MGALWWLKKISCLRRQLSPPCSGSWAGCCQGLGTTARLNRLWVLSALAAPLASGSAVAASVIGMLPRAGKVLLLCLLFLPGGVNTNLWAQWDDSDGWAALTSELPSVRSLFSTPSQSWSKSNERMLGGVELGLVGVHLRGETQWTPSQKAFVSNVALLYT